MELSSGGNSQGGSISLSAGNSTLTTKSDGGLV